LVKNLGDPVGLKEQAGLSIPCSPVLVHYRGAGIFKKGGLNNGVVAYCYNPNRDGRSNLFFDYEKEKMSK
jgi:hypothetical protein